MFKNVEVTESSRFQFRAEFFNLFNCVNYWIPGMTVIGTNGRLDPVAGRITATRTRARQIQFALKFNF